MLLEGLHIPLTTPFHPDGRLNSPKLSANIARYSKTPASGLIVLGPNGEPTLLSDEETRETLRAAAAAATSEKVLIAGIPRDSVHSALTLAAFAAEQHYDAVLISPPAILVTTRELLTYFQTIADRSPLPIVLSNTVARPIPATTTIELAAHPSIIAILDATADLAGLATIRNTTAAIKHETTVTPTFAAVTTRMRTVANRATLISAATLTGSSATAMADPPPIPSLKTRTKTIGFQIIAGSTALLFDSLQAGATAIAPAFAACAPQACYEVFAAWKDSDLPLAQEKQTRLTAAAHLAESAMGLLKFGCDLNGYFGGLPRLPHLPPTGEQRAELENFMQGMRT